eukprot:Plantae.Rhodophyta-Purpureofilum_apyrenoidigerum.ctg5538.p1 GENE.Plantae.Rhodophyta-Purpureofilum_apyrenoidigerum.ctg5538~~Plantae.Rhodophyta-Purpureofilum_apyrenoidigerum.ctg5538.p1  ORF type:complete len:387 (+),score=83.24 Plantae.Rhodophyta-Purpureofilum_apyrenoidigerum.ctg5538:148-1308(+)
MGLIRVLPVAVFAATRSYGPMRRRLLGILEVRRCMGETQTAKSTEKSSSRSAAKELKKAEGKLKAATAKADAAATKAKEVIDNAVQGVSKAAQGASKATQGAQQNATDVQSTVEKEHHPQPARKTLGTPVFTVPDVSDVDIKELERASDLWNKSMFRISRHVFLRILPMAQEPETSEHKVRQEIANQIEMRSKWRFTNNLEMAKDDAGTRHLHMACIVMAAYEVLREKYGEDRSVKMLGRVLNDQQARVASTWMGKFLMWIAKVLQGSEEKRQRAVYESIAKDFGSAFDPQLTETPEQLKLVLPKCLYHRFFTKEGAPQLTKLFCEMDINNFSGFSGQQSVVLEQTIADGAKTCVFTYDRPGSSTKKAKAGPREKGSPSKDEDILS